MDFQTMLRKLDGESGMYKDWMIENVVTYRTSSGFGGADTIELEIYDEYTEAPFPADELELLSKIVAMLAVEPIELMSYIVEGTTVKAMIA